MKDLVNDIRREQMPRYIFRDGAWFCVQGDYYKAWYAGTPRVWPTSKPRPVLRVVR